MIKPNWDIFKAKFSENPQKNFERFCYLLFCREHKFPKGIFRYKNQSAIETEPVEVENKTIGWQSRFYDVSLSQKNKEIIETIKKSKKDYPNLTDLFFYTNKEWGQGKGGKEPKGKIEAEKKAKEIGLTIDWRMASFFESEFVSIENEEISKDFFLYLHKKQNDNVLKPSLIPITFRNLNTKYTTPLTCSGLSEKDIQVCPSNELYIDSIKRNLELAHKCIIRGKSGTGKSLLTYQMAKVFYDDGWDIYKIDKNALSNNTFSIPNKKVLLLVDDAQTLSISYFEFIIENAYENCLVLLNWNSESNENSEFLRSYPCVDIIPFEQVKMIEKYSLEYKEEIIKVLKKKDININQKDYWDNIERRIKKASLEPTPWLFNYSLTEGWRKAENDMKLLSDDENLSLVMTVVAFFQIGTQDKGVTKKIILNELEHYNNDNRWKEKASNVIDEYCINDGEIIRHKHYLYAKEVLYSLENIDEYIIEFIKRFLTNIEYEYGYSSLLEYIGFYHKDIKQILNEENFIVDRTRYLFKDSISEDEVKIKNLNSLIRFDKSVLLVISENIEILDNWLLTSNKNTVLALEEFVNTLYNEKFSDLNLTNEMLKHTLSKIIESDIIESAKFSSLYDRLHLFSSAEQKNKCFQNIEKASISFSISNTNLEIDAYNFSKIIINLGYINEDWSKQCLSNNLEFIAHAFNTDVLKACDLYNDLIGRYFGVILRIVNNKTTNKNKRLAQQFIKLIKTESILHTFSLLTRFNMQRFCMFLIFISMNDKKRLNEISIQVDYKYLKKIYQDDTDLAHWHKGILKILYNPKYKPYEEYVVYLIDKNEYLEKLLVVFNPDLSEKRLKEGKKYKMEFHGDDGYHFSLLLIKSFDEDNNKELSNRIIQENKNSIQETIFNNISNIDGSKYKYDFLVYLFHKNPNFIKELFDDKEKVDNLIRKIPSLLRGKKIEKKIGNLYLFFIVNFSKIHQGKVKKLKSKFSSISRFKI